MHLHGLVSAEASPPTSAAWEIECLISLETLKTTYRKRVVLLQSMHAVLSWWGVDGSLHGKLCVFVLNATSCAVGGGQGVSAEGGSHGDA